MLKALLKKQLLELNQFYFQDRKKGKRRSKAGATGMIALFVAIFFSVGLAFYGISVAIGVGTLQSGIQANDSSGWIYFAIMGILAIALGTFGSVFNTYASLYRAKDNEALLSLPIPAGMLLFVRMVGVYLMSFLYVALAWIPTIIHYWVVAWPSGRQIVCSILMTFVITLFVTVLTCVLGWLVALGANKAKGKNYVVVGISVAIMLVYYYICFHMQQLLQSLSNHAEEIGETIRAKVYPLYKLGLGATGDVASFLIFTGISVGLFLLLYYVMTKSFLRILTTSHGSKKVEYNKAGSTKVSGYASALLRKERLRFTGSSTYMLNSGIGLIFMVVIGVFALVKSNDLLGMIAEFSEELPMIYGLLPIIACMLVCMMVSMSCVSAPSISLEGKNLWILKTLPISGWDILQAKERFHMFLNLIPSMFCMLCLCFALKEDFSSTILSLVIVWAFILFTADFGLFWNLKYPNLNWAQETVAVKQSVSVLLTLFIGWGICIGMILGGGLFAFFEKEEGWLVICILIVAILYRILHRWLQTKGAEKLESL